MKYFIDSHPKRYVIVPVDKRGDWEDWCLYDGGKFPPWVRTIEPIDLAAMTFEVPESLFFQNHG